MPSQKTSDIDNIYAKQLDKIDSFAFTRQVVSVFPDMIERSVPGYKIIIDGIAKLTDLHTQKNDLVYDLGCSLGAVSLAIAKVSHSKACRIVGIDNSPAMVEKCKENISAYSFAKHIDIQEGNIEQFPIQNAKVIVMNFTMQFIEPDRRQALLNKLYNGLASGGILIVSEKIKHDNSMINESLIEMHHDFKRYNGYSDLEISQKRTALEKVMLLDSQQTHIDRFLSAGFSDASLWFQQYNFASFLAVKSTS